MIRAVLLCVALTCGAQEQQDSDRGLIEAVVESSDEDLGAALQQAFERFLEHVDAYALPEAEALIRAMHERSQATWSAESYAMLLGSAGRFDEARAVLDDQLARSAGDFSARSALLKTRALSSLGAGHEARARRELGVALLHGSSDAAVVLARIALSSGHPERARAVARALLDQEPAPSWALRAWGLSMLPPAPSR